MKVYILSDYEEHGAENVEATTEPEKLPSMLATFFGGKALTEREALSNLERKGYPINPDGHNLSNGWGGIMLHIVELK